MWTSWCTGESSSSQIRSPALLPSVTLSRMVGRRHCARSISEGREQEERRGRTCSSMRTLKDFMEQQSGITLESRSPLSAWLVEHCSNLLLLFHKGEPHDGHTAYIRLKGKQWRVELPSFGECADCQKRTRHKLESRWSRAVRVKTTERCVMDETGTYVVQSVRRVPEEQR